RPDHPHPGRMPPCHPIGGLCPRGGDRRRRGPPGGDGDRGLHGGAQGMKSPEPVHVVKQRREGLLRSLVDGVPYIRFLGVEFDRRGDELTAVLPFSESLIGNPRLPALHGGATAAFLEISAMIELAWSTLWDG